MLISLAVNVDVDWMDPTFSKSLPIVPNDMTSNQLWVDIQMSHPDNREMFLNTVKEYKDKGWLAIYTRMVISNIFLLPRGRTLTDK